MQVDEIHEVPTEAMKTTKAEIQDLSKEIESFQERIKSFNTLVQMQKPSSATSQTQKEPEELTESLTNFGWTEIEGWPALPFVRKGSDCYVANQIYAEKILPNIFNVLSVKTVDCVAVRMSFMTQSEADVFNEINVHHCDRSLVGNYCFKPGERMSDLEDIKLSTTFFQVCEDLLRFKKIDNNLFGFLRIAGQSEVPFIWDEGRKLVPLFYFEGQSEYLDARSVDLTDKWKLRYLKFCCLVQNIRKDHYEQNPLKVVDFEHIKELFPADTSFELHVPRDPNQELLVPAMRTTAPSYTNNQSPRSSVIVPAINSVQTKENNGNENLGLTKCHRTNLKYKVPRDRRSGNKIKRSPVGPQPMPYPSPFKGLSITPVTSRECAEQVANTLDRVTITPVGPQGYAEQSQSIPSFQAARVNSQITNVPYRSPQTASSPGCQIPSPLMNEGISSTSPPLAMQPASNTPVQYSDQTFNNQFVYAQTTTQFQVNQSNWCVQQQQQQRVRIIQSHTVIPPFHQPARNLPPPYTSTQHQITQQPVVFQMTPALREKLRDFLTRFLRSMDSRNVESRIGELAYTFLLENKVTSMNEIRKMGPHIEIELKHLWIEMLRNSALMSHQNSFRVPGPPGAQILTDNMGNYLPGSVTASRTSECRAFVPSRDEINNNYL